jgi:hypothetical protein
VARSKTLKNICKEKTSCVCPTDFKLVANHFMCRHENDKVQNRWKKSQIYQCFRGKKGDERAIQSMNSSNVYLTVAREFFKLSCQ